MQTKSSVSGIKPTGQLHLGNYLGAIRYFVSLQEDNNVKNFYFIADYHALNSICNPKELEQNTLEMFMAMIALGINPQKSTLFIQSSVPQVTELAWLLTGITPMGLMERSHAYKDKKSRSSHVNMGLFNYPILQAADILLYEADLVPVGQDQKQHIEIARDIAEKFNRTYGSCFKIPEAQIIHTESVPGIDGEKMSKSHKNTIPIFVSEKEIKKSVMRIVTDSTPMESPKNHENCPVYNLYALFASDEEIKHMQKMYAQGNYGYGQAKIALLEIILLYFSDARKTMETLKNNQDYVQQLIKMGAEKALIVAEKKIKSIRIAMGLP